MKLAIIQDQLLTEAGSERVFLYMAQEFREADIITLAYNPATTWPEFRDFHIRTSWLNRFIQTHRRFKQVFPLSTRVMQHWDLNQYDVILSSSATTAKYIRNHRARHICYCYYPTRAIWNFGSYFDGARPGFSERIFRHTLEYMKRRDREAAACVDRFIAISESSRQAIRTFYNRDAEVLFSPIDVDRFVAGATMPKTDRYLMVGRLERWKRTDLAIEAFNQLGLPLDIIGTGPEEGSLRAAAGPNIRFLGRADDATLVRAYGSARAVVYTPELEYGLVPLEAAAAGTPVIALGRGGILETMIGPNDAARRPATAVFFDEQTPESLMRAIRQFEAIEFRKGDLMARAASFGISEFRRRLRAIVTSEMAKVA
ncbi:MAG TPA: glycosyltransferase [Gemmatimonadaceae bacterium]|jgi:glycosyltransferase involved in cell wall biosynthesis